MMKEEFDKLVGITTDPKCYEKIEYVYMWLNFFENKKQIANFYNLYDMNGIEKMYNECLYKEKTVNIIYELSADLQSSKLEIESLKEEVEKAKIMMKSIKEIFKI